MDKKKAAQKELNKITHRTYAPANLIDKAGDETIFNERNYFSFRK